MLYILGYIINRMEQENKKKKNKHKISTIVLLVLIGLLFLVGTGVLAIDIGDDSECPDGFGIMTSANKWACVRFDDIITWYNITTVNNVSYYNETVINASQISVRDNLTVQGESYFKDDVGIGTKSPNTDLDIGDGLTDNIDLRLNKVGSSTGKLKFATAGTTDWEFQHTTGESLELIGSVENKDFTINVNDGGVQKDMFIIDSSVPDVSFPNGKVGIGTTSPDRMLEIEGATASIHLDSTNNALLDIDRASSSYNSEVRFSTGGSTGWVTGIGDSDLLGDGTDFFIGQTAGGENADLVIDTDGRVGIGTTKPTNQKLVINGTAGTGTAIQFQERGSRRGIIGLDEGWLFDGALANSISVFSDNALHLGASGASGLTITVLEDRVGIGTTSPSTELELKANAVNDEVFKARNSAGTERIQMHVNATSSLLRMKGLPGETIRFDSNGNSYIISGSVGIGTTSPNTNLDIEGSATQEMRVRDTTNGNALYLIADDNAGYIRQATGTNGLKIQTNGSNTAIAVSTSQNVGIGASSPSYPLEVDKDIGGVSIYTSANVSAEGFIDRTKGWIGTSESALNSIISISNDGVKIDHSTIPEFAKGKYYEPIKTKENETYVEQVCETRSNEVQQEVCNDVYIIINKTFEVDECGYIKDDETSYYNYECWKENETREVHKTICHNETETKYKEVEYNNITYY